MDWDKAKTFAIFLFLILNAFLFLLNMSERKKHTLTDHQQASIVSLLSKNEILLEAEIPKEYKPRAKLLLTKTSFDFSHLTNVFFEDVNNVQRTFVNNHTVFKDQTSSLYINTDSITFENTGEQIVLHDLNEKSAKNIADHFIKKINLGFGPLVLNAISFDENHFYLKYYECYDNELLFLNYIDVTVSKYGVQKLSANRYAPTGYTGQKRDIYSADEALFSMMRYFKDKNISISSVWKMDLGYAISEEINEVSRSAAPYYMIYADSYTVMVNAYTNEIIFDYASPVLSCIMEND